MIEFDFRHRQGDFLLNATARLVQPVVGLFGPSGAGKSTLFNMIAGLQTPDSGRLLVDADCLFDSETGVNIPLHQRRIGVVFQESRLFPHLRVVDNLVYGYRLLKPAQRQFNPEHIVELLEIGHLLEHRPYQLSGGEKQRVAIGRALLSSPRLLLLDEPLASLDVRLKNQILPFLRRVKEEIRIPMLYVSHAIDELLYLTTYLAMMDKGELLAAGTFHDIMQNQQLLGLAHSLGLENVLHVRLQETGTPTFTLALLGDQEISIPEVSQTANEQISISIAASNIALATLKVEGTTIQNQLTGVVSTVNQIGNRVLVTVDVEGYDLIAEVTLKAMEALNIIVGRPVYCLIKTQSIRPLVPRISD